MTGVAVSCPNLYRGAPTHLPTGYTPLTEPQSRADPGSAQRAEQDGGQAVPGGVQHGAVPGLDLPRLPDGGAPGGGRLPGHLVRSHRHHAPDLPGDDSAGSGQGG